MTEDSKSTEEITVDIPAEVVSENVDQEEHWIDKITDKQRREFERKRVTQINKILKNIKRREKNFMTIISKMDNK